MAHRVDDRERCSRRGAIVEIMDRQPVDDLGQDRELAANGGDVEAHLQDTHADAGTRTPRAASASGVSMSVVGASPVISTFTDEIGMFADQVTGAAVARQFPAISVG